MSNEVLLGIWQATGLEPAALDNITLPSQPGVLPSSFHVGTAAQVSIGAAALAAAQLYQLRSGHSQHVHVVKADAELECTGYFKLNGITPGAWEKFSGLYATRDGHVRIHANFEHHRDGVLALLGLPGADEAERSHVEAALAQWSAAEFESAASERGLVAAMVRSFQQWDEHPHAIAAAAQPLLKLTKLDDCSPVGLAHIERGQRPLEGLRVLDLTRILAGPIGGRTLAAYGADVMLVNAPHLPNIASIIDTSRGKRSVHLDLRHQADNQTFDKLMADSHIFVQGYRPGGLNSLGYGPEELAARHPGMVYVSLSAYGSVGPWADRRGFDSLVQTATGFNHAEAEAAGTTTPKTLPMPILDYASGFLMAFGAQAALLKQARQGGSWHVEVSLYQTAKWLRSLGRIDSGFDRSAPDMANTLCEFPCGEGILQGMPHAAEFSATPATWMRASSMPGTDTPDWG